MEIALIILAISLGFFVQTVVGFAASAVAVPLLLIVLDIRQSITLISILLFFFSVIMVYQSWKDINRRIVWQMVIGIIPGMLVGIFVLKHGSPVFLKRFLGFFIISYVMYSFLRKRSIALLRKLSIATGFIGGIFSGLFATGGPFYVAYITNRLNRANAIRATIIGVLAIINILRLPMLAYNSMITAHIIIIALYAFPAFLLSIYLGQRFYRRINEAYFRNILLSVLLVSGLLLIIR